MGIIDEVSGILGDGYNYTETSDGGVIISDKNGRFSMGLGPNYKNDSAQVTFYNGYRDGSGGNTLGPNNQQTVINNIMGQNDNTIAVAVNNCYDSSHVFSLIDPIRKQLGIAPTEFVNIGYSDGGGGTTRNFVDEVRNNNTQGGVILLFDSHNVSANTSKEDAELLAASGTKIVLCGLGGKDDFTNPHSGFADYPNHGLKNMMDAGVELYLISAEGAGHGQIDDYGLNDNIAGYLLGNIDEPGTSERYTCYRYNPETGELESVDFATLQSDVGIGLTPEELRNRYPDSLDDFAARYRGESDTLAANICYVHDACENIYTGISCSLVETSQYNGNEGEAGLFGNVHNASNYFVNISNGVLTNMGDEANTINEIANQIYKMDQFAANIASITLDDNVRNDLFGGFESSLSDFNSKLADSINTSLTGEISHAPVVEGKVGVVNVASLNNMINSFAPTFENEVANAKYINGMISDFSSGLSGDMFSGKLWDSVRSNLDTYSNLMNLRSDGAEFLSNTMKAAVMYILDYMDPDTELDDSKLPELENNLRIAKSNLDGAKSSLAYAEAHPLTTSEITLEDGTIKTVTSGYSDSQIAEYRAAVDFYQEQYDELDKIITKLKGLAEVMNTAQKMIDDALEQVNSAYGNAAKQIKNNKSFSYDFKLDLSAYNISEEAYNGYLDRFNTYYENINSADYVTPEQSEMDTTPQTYNPNIDTSPANEEKIEAPESEKPAPETPSNPGTPSSPSNPETPSDEHGGETPSEEQGGETPSEEQPQEETPSEEQPQEEEPGEEQEELPVDDTPVDEDIAVFVNEEEDNKNPKKPNVNKKPSSNTNKKPVDVVKPEVVVEPIIEPEVVVEPEVVIEPNYNINTTPDPVYVEPIYNNVHNNKNSAGKTIGIAAGIGAVVGGAALGTHTITKSKKDNDVDSDYGYE